MRQQQGSLSRKQQRPAVHNTTCILAQLLVGAVTGADVQAYLNGVEHPVFRNFFTVKTFIAKVIGSALAVGSSLVMGKEGPMLHAGSILAVILGELQQVSCAEGVLQLSSVLRVTT
jgi:H+/Cl- antiporter ClcA